MRLAGLVEPLTAREVEVLDLLAAGMSNEEIAASLFVSLNTVKTHLKNVYGKLGVASRTQAAVRSLELGIIGTPESRDASSETPGSGLICPRPDASQGTRAAAAPNPVLARPHDGWTHGGPTARRRTWR